MSQALRDELENATDEEIKQAAEAAKRMAANLMQYAEHRARGRAELATITKDAVVTEMARMQRNLGVYGRL